MGEKSSVVHLSDGVSYEHNVSCRKQKGENSRSTTTTQQTRTTVVDER